MVVYEVNLEVESGVFDAYNVWLLEHIEQMLKFDGFSGYNLSINTEHQDGVKLLTVWYYLETMTALDDYLENHSKEMRDDGIKKFGDKFSASRRIFDVDKCSVEKMIIS
ncbi:DUF4286 family protein [Francisellaceae bacterium CB300]